MMDRMSISMAGNLLNDSLSLLTERKLVQLPSPVSCDLRLPVSSFHLPSSSASSRHILLIDY